MIYDDCNAPTFELETSSTSESIHHAKTSPAFEKHPEAFDEVEFNLTPKKNQQKHGIRHSIASSPANMNSHAFMHTYNNFPSSARPSPSQTNLNNSAEKKNKRPWYSVS